MTAPILTRLLDQSSAWEAVIDALGRESLQLRTDTAFPEASVRLCAHHEVLWAAEEPSAVASYVAMAYGCLTVAFIMTQRNAAIRRIRSSGNERIQADVLAAIESGETFATVGISHLTTSRKHLATPPVRATRVAGGWRLDGVVPWVTGAAHATYLVLGAVEVDASAGGTQELLFLVPTARPGLTAGKGMDLLALTASCTDVVTLEQVEVWEREVLHGPCPNVIAASQAGGAGGLQTSALALGLAGAAIDFLHAEAAMRGSLQGFATKLTSDWESVYGDLVKAAVGTSVRGGMPVDGLHLRKRANDLALQSTQSAMTVAKGAGFVSSHPVARWCREAMFFLVWSCPQDVALAHLCSLSNMEDSLHD
jgi:alkylation response protein AidB-like acyl-CoA dehydrogenase